MVSGDYFPPQYPVHHYRGALRARRCGPQGAGKPGAYARDIFLLLLGTLPSSLMFEYGSIILFFVIFGQMRRFPDKMSMDKRYLYLFVFLSFFLFLFSQD